MLNNLTNFFNLIAGKRVKTTANPDDLITLGVRDPRTPGIYQPAAIKVSDLVSTSGVTSVTGTAPVVSSGGSTPAISMPAATTLVSGYLTSTDFNTFNSKLQGVHSLMFLPSTSVTNQKITGSPTLTGLLLTANTIIAAPFIPAQNITTSNLSIYVTNLFAGALCRIAIYSNVNGVPSNILYLSSDLDLSTTGVKTALTTFNFVAGTTYWLAIHGGTTGTAGVTGIGISDLIPIKGASITGSSCSVTASFTFTSGTPTLFPTPTFTNNTMPEIRITKA